MAILVLVLQTQQKNYTLLVMLELLVLYMIAVILLELLRKSCYLLELVRLGPKLVLPPYRAFKVLKEDRAFRELLEVKEAQALKDQLERREYREDKAFKA